MSLSAMIIGATSSLGVALTRQLAARGNDVTLVGRDEHELKLLADDVAIRYGVKTSTICLDLTSSCINLKLFKTSTAESVFMLAGAMGSDDFDSDMNIENVTNINYTSPAKIIGAMLPTMKERSHGNIIIVSSVAGDRGRASNYVYGSAKAALSAFASGLRNRMAASNVHVMTVKPGFIDTPMTFGMKSPLIASREAVANTILSSLSKKRDVVYAPFFWRYIMLIICHIPERIFKRLSL